MYRNVAHVIAIPSERFAVTYHFSGRFHFSRNESYTRTYRYNARVYDTTTPVTYGVTAKSITAVAAGPTRTCRAPPPKSVKLLLPGIIRLS